MSSYAAKTPPRILTRRAIETAASDYRLTGAKGAQVSTSALELFSAILLEAQHSKASAVTVEAVLEAAELHQEDLCVQIAGLSSPKSPTGALSDAILMNLSTESPRIKGNARY